MALLLAAAVGVQAQVSGTASQTVSTTGESLGPAQPVSASTSTLDTSNPFLGGVTGQLEPGVVRLTLQGAIQRGLRYNLGLFLSGQGTTAARGARLRALSGLLPSLNAHVAESEEQLNLAALGFPSTLAKSFGISTIAGPFGIFDTRATLSESLSLAAYNNYKASIQNLSASNLSYQNARDLVVLVSGGLYMQALAGAARIQAVQAQVTTAQSLYNLAVDQKRAGVTPAIDVLRAQVELQVQEQRLVAARNDFDKQKLILARAIGMPVAQQFEFAETGMPNAPMPPIAFDQALDRAFKNRSDYKAAQVQERAAELTRKAAVSERLPSIQFNGDYGVLGNTPGSSHGTFTATGALVIPIFQGGRIKGDIVQADALLAQRQAELKDMRNRVEFEVRSAFLDLNSAAQQVAVAQSSVGLAQEQVKQAQDRFAAGVTNNVEVIQAQEALATTNDNYINSLLAHNLAKLSLARALGVAEEATKEFLGGTQ
jgi:outer membrane protein TolC